MPDAPEAKAEITDLTVEFISLVDKPATGKIFVLKDEAGRDRPGREIRFIKMDDEMRIAYGIVYPAGEVDAHGDWASAATVRKAAERFMQARHTDRVDVQHSFRQEPNCAVVESWIVRKGDPLFGGEPEGSWAAGVKVYDPDIWKALKDGKLSGFSLAGVGARAEGPSSAEKAAAEKAAEGFFARLIDLFKNAPPADDTPDDTSNKEPDPMADLSEKDVTRIADAVIAKMQGAQPPGGTAPSTSPPAPEPAPQAGADLAGVLKSVAEGQAAIAKTLDSLPATLAVALAKGRAEGGFGGGAGAGSSVVC